MLLVLKSVGGCPFSQVYITKTFHDKRIQVDSLPVSVTADVYCLFAYYRVFAPPSPPSPLALLFQISY